MDLASVWQEVERFRAQALATTGAIYGDATELELVSAFLAKVPLDAIKDVCSCIDRVLRARSNGVPLFFRSEIAPFILAGLQHEEKQARVLTLNQFVTHLSMAPELENVASVADAPIVAQLCSVVAEEDLEVASKATKALELIANVPDSGLYKIVLDALKATVMTSISDTSVEFMRYLETIANVCAQADEHMQYAVSSHTVDVVLHCLQSNDPLFLMNVVDLVPKLCGTAVGVQHIFESGTLQTLLAMTEDPFVGGNAVRLVGEISSTAAKLHIPSWSWSDPTLSRAFLETVEAKLQSSDPTQQIAAMDALAAFASTSDKELELLLRHEAICKLWLPLGSSTKLPLKTNCLHSVARILEEPTAIKRSPSAVPAENAGMWLLLARLFAGLGSESHKQSTMTLLMELLRQPFEDVRVAVFAVLRATAAQNNEWGMRALHSYGGFFEFLLDRTTEPTKETREWKFAVLDAVVASPFHSRLDAVTLDKLKDSLRRGPYVGAAPAGTELEAA